MQCSDQLLHVHRKHDHLAQLLEHTLCLCLAACEAVECNMAFSKFVLDR